MSEKHIIAARDKETLHAAVQRQTPWLNGLGFQFSHYCSNTGVAVFKEEVALFPLFMEYSISPTYGTHIFRVSIRKLKGDITFQTPWVMSGKDTLDPRIKLMREYADKLREGLNEPKKRRVMCKQWPNCKCIIRGELKDCKTHE